MIVDQKINSNIQIPLTKPYIVGNEEKYVQEVIRSGKLGGNGAFTQKCQAFFEERYGFQKCLLTTSCTDALEMCAILLDIKEGDEVIVPSYNFPSAANAFLLRGAKVVFAPSRQDHPGMDEEKVEALVNEKTRVIVVMHYAGVATDMDVIQKVAKKHNLKIVEDAAHALKGKYKSKYLGSIGDLATFSFHESKNITCGEGGMLVINNSAYNDRAELLWQMGTNRAAFQRGESKHYSWKDVGSSFLPSELNAAFLYGQLEQLDHIQSKRRKLWNTYYKELRACESPLFRLPQVPDYAEHPAHNFYVILGSKQVRDNLQAFLYENGIAASSHFRDLASDFNRQGGMVQIQKAPYKLSFEDTLLRLPMMVDLSKIDQENIINLIRSSVKNRLNW